MKGKKIACLFPGIGYTCDKPLLYYSWKLLKGLGWEVVPVPYTGFPSGVKGNPEKMQQAAHMALEQAEEILNIAKSHVEQVCSETENYLPEQYAVAKQARTLRIGSSAALFISPDAEAMEEIFRQGFKG